jgi:pimeloyl-ACP methyl ester carboxylesterase
MDLGRFARCALGCSLIAGCSFAVSPLGYAEGNRHKNIRQIDHAVPHVSTLGANTGELVDLFVRELVQKHDDDDDDDGDRHRARKRGDDRDDKHRPRKAVLMVHGANISPLALFDLRYKDYSWGRALAKAGFDVFILDSQGIGRSPLPDRALAPLTDPCNVTPAQQAAFLRDHPPFVAEPCDASFPFPFLLINSKSEWDELSTVVDYIISERGVEKVALIGVSRGSIVVGPYTVQHPEKVESLFLQAPNLNPAALPGIGSDALAPPVKSFGQLPDLSTRFVPCTAAEVATNSCPGILPEATRPHRILPPLNATFPAAMALSTRQDLNDRWQRDIGCDGQVEEGVQDRVWRAIMENDKLPSTWGPPPAGAPAGTAPEGLMRNRSFFPWGWTPSVASRLQVPTLIVFGEHDKEVGGPGLPLAVTSVRLYDTIPAEVPKLLFKVACAGHLMVWERQRNVLHRLSKQWLKHGSVEGHSTGKFFVTTDGDLEPME